MNAKTHSCRELSPFDGPQRTLRPPTQTAFRFSSAPQIRLVVSSTHHSVSDDSRPHQPSFSPRASGPHHGPSALCGLRLQQSPFVAFRLCADLSRVVVRTSGGPHHRFPSRDGRRRICRRNDVSIINHPSTQYLRLQEENHMEATLIVELVHFSGLLRCWPNFPRPHRFI